MTEMIYKTFRAEVKGSDATTGEVDLFVPLSTEAQDRQGEVIDIVAWKKALPAFRKHPVLVSSHTYSDLRKQIGDFVSLKVTDEGILGKPRYYIGEGNPEADWAFKLAQKNMAAFSVGFIPLKYDDGDGEKTPRRRYKEIDWLEVSQVIVPSNREAIQNIRSKGLAPLEEKLIEEVLADKELMPELVTKPETTEQYHRVPVAGEEGKHEGHRIRTITVSEKDGIKALYCGQDKVIITYLFDVEEWSMEEAKRWVKEHKEGEGESQKSIRDELDYTRMLIAQGKLNDEAKAMAWEIVREVLRTAGSEMPDDILKQLQKAKATQDLEDCIAKMKECMDMMTECLDMMSGMSGEAEEGKKKEIVREQKNIKRPEIVAMVIDEMTKYWNKEGKN